MTKTNTKTITHLPFGETIKRNRYRLKNWCNIDNIESTCCTFLRNFLSLSLSLRIRHLEKKWTISLFINFSLDSTKWYDVDVAFIILEKLMVKFCYKILRFLIFLTNLKRLRITYEWDVLYNKLTCFSFFLVNVSF